jgi:hypothetical protein
VSRAKFWRLSDPSWRPFLPIGAVGLDRWPDPERRRPGRAASPAGGKIQSLHQPQNRKSSWPGGTSDVAGGSERGVRTRVQTDVTSLPLSNVRPALRTEGSRRAAHIPKSTRSTRPRHGPAREPTAATSIENDFSSPRTRVRVLAQSNASKRRRRLINLHIHGIDLIEHDRLFACGMIK